MKRIQWLFIPLLLAFGMILSCSKESTDDTIQIINHEVYKLMKEIYLWYDHLPEVDPGSYDTPEDLMDALRFQPYDRWSFVITKAEYEQYFEEGKMIGHGFLLSMDNDGNVRIAFVYRSTQAYESGVRRSWIVKKVNGTVVTIDNVFDLLGPSTEGIANSIEFIDKEGTAVTLNLTKEEVDITPVLDYQVITQGTDKIGYLVFQDFIETANEELDEAFNYFVSAGVDEMIVDMRYNGGGSVDVAEYLGSWLIGKDFAGLPFIRFRHNDKYAAWDTTINVLANTNGLSLDRIFFIGTSSTASASELVINNVKPYTGAILTGESTHGKPVGMYAFPLENFNIVVLPISFQTTNADDEGDYYDGIAPDLLAGDDLTRDFGDPDEESLAAILSYIETGGLALKSARSVSESRLIEQNRPINEFLKAY
ncbi:MAG: hypothetical protein JXA61_04815 [Bacteroidales bacterium]|nr:hypothetical protein [Bacteroidales bacterium]